MLSIKDVWIVCLAAIHWELWRRCRRWTFRDATGNLSSLSTRSPFELRCKVWTEHFERLKVRIVDRFFNKHYASVWLWSDKSAQRLNQFYSYLIIFDMLQTLQCSSIATVSWITQHRNIGMHNFIWKGIEINKKEKFKSSFWFEKVFETSDKEEMGTR